MFELNQVKKKIMREFVFYFYDDDADTRDEIQVCNIKIINVCILRSISNF